MQQNGNGNGGLGLGIDTGGTYTDAAILSMSNGNVLSKAKALTTRHDLAEGIGNAIEMLDHDLFKRIRLVAISSTLATNSVVEGKGCRVGLIVIGNDPPANIPVDEMLLVRGGHNLQGDEKAPLDVDMVRTFIEAVKNKVDGFAVSSYLSVRNPEHEVAVKAMVQSMTKHPVVCGHELSSALGFNERTITAVLNARLIPIIADLIASLKRVQDRLDIRAPLMIVKGDGSLMDESVARERPVETILSGPAASIIGAKALTGLQDAIIIDVGGTTTDIGILRDGRPRLDPEGAVLGGWRTRVKAVDAFTSGIGGDSRIVVARNRVHLTSLRVIPLCIASATYPAVKRKLEAMRGDSKWVPPYMEVEAVPQMTEFYIFCKDVVGPEISSDQGRILNMVKEEPMTIYEIAERLDTHPLSLSLRKMEDLGMVLRIGLTPTDILHAEGSYVHYDATASKLGVEIQSSLLEMPESELIAQVKDMVMEKIATEVLKKLVMENIGDTKLDQVGSALVNDVVKGASRRDFTCKLAVNKPLIGIGAPVAAYLPLVAERFQTKLVLPEHSEVGNAAGAISGNIMETVEMLIKPKKGMGVMDNPPCTLFWMAERRDFETLTEALDYAKGHGASIAREKALASGADTVEVVVENHRKEAKMEKGWGEAILLEVNLTITGVGKPRLYYEGKH